MRNNNLARKHEASALTKADENSPCLKVTESNSVSIKAGTSFAGRDFDEDTPVTLPQSLEIGRDYYVMLDDDGSAYADIADNLPNEGDFAGFHYAPGGNASAREGGDDKPAINPFSLWDQNFRPSCNDPRGMALVEVLGKKIWVDIYLCGVDHLDKGTSVFGETIADGDDLPQNPAGKRFKRFDYEAATAVMKHHGKQLLSVEEFFAATFGVKERSSTDEDSETTKLDAARTSKFGIMQATGNMWVWGTDGDPDEPRASIFGGSWFSRQGAGSRYAHLGRWPVLSVVALGARGRSDHLQPA